MSVLPGTYARQLRKGYKTMKVTFNHLVDVSLGLILLTALLNQLGVGWEFQIMPLAAVLGIWIGYLTR